MLPPGDLALELDIYVEDEMAGALSEADLAQGLAVRTATSVLYPSMDIDLDSAYWVAVPDGRVGRCRLEAIDSDEDTRYRVDAVEEKVADLPRAKVEWLPEALEYEPIGTPLSDAFLATYPTDTAASVDGRVHYSLRVWERLVRRLESDWSPSGRYREDLFRRDLEARDTLARLVREVDDVYAEGLRSSVTRLDGIFRVCTEPGNDEKAERWWWCRRPRHVPW